MKFSLFVASSALLAGSNAFAPAKTSNILSSTSLNLLPNQGCQLVAASAAALAKESESATSASSELHPPQERPEATPTTAARELVSRIFNLPSQIFSSPVSTSTNSETTDFPIQVVPDAVDDNVVFPIVGFQFVTLETESGKNKIRAFPSTNTGGFCNIDSFHKARSLPTYGWFSPACQLGDVYANDESYCGEPKDEEHV